MDGHGPFFMASLQYNMASHNSVWPQYTTLWSLWPMTFHLWPPMISYGLTTVNNGPWFNSDGIFVYGHIHVPAIRILDFKPKILSYHYGILVYGKFQPTFSIIFKKSFVVFVKMSLVKCSLMAASFNLIDIFNTGKIDFWPKVRNISPYHYHLWH